MTSRVTARFGSAPPIRAEIAPVSANATKVTMKVTGMRQAYGGTRTAASGDNAPGLKAIKDAIAAVQGLTRSSSSIP